jgi:hypothetical protein
MTKKLLMESLPTKKKIIHKCENGYKRHYNASLHKCLDQFQ